MKTIAVVGGIGPESTIEYYRCLIAFTRELGGSGAPPVLINSIDVDRMLGMIGSGQMREVTRYLADGVSCLARAGADIGLLAANTPHIVFDDIQRAVSIPLVSIVQATLDHAKTSGIARLGLFGTRFTMQGGFYQAVFARNGATIVVPEPAEQEFIHEKYVGELLRSVFLPATHDRLVAIARRMRDEAGIEALILGGTELPLILRDEAAAGVPLLDTTRIHARAIVVRALDDAR